MARFDYSTDEKAVNRVLHAAYTLNWTETVLVGKCLGAATCTCLYPYPVGTQRYIDVDKTYQLHEVEMTSYWYLCHVITSHRRRFDDVTTSWVCWVCLLEKRSRSLECPQRGIVLLFFMETSRSKSGFQIQGSKLYPIFETNKRISVNRYSCSGGYGPTDAQTNG